MTTIVIQLTSKQATKRFNAWMKRGKNRTATKREFFGSFDKRIYLRGLNNKK